MNKGYPLHLNYKTERRQNTIEKKFNQSEYIAEYVKENYKRFELRLNKKTEQDLIEHLDKQPNRNDYIRSLIKKDMQK